MMNDANMLLFLILLSSIFLLIVGVAVLLSIRYRKFHSKPYILAASYYYIQSIGIATIVITSMISDQVTRPFDEVIAPFPLIFGYFPLLAFLAYLCETKRPGWLTLRKFLLFLAPAAVLSVILIILPEITDIKSINELISSLGKVDVIVRLLIALSYLLYLLFLVLLPYDWRHCLVSGKVMTAFLVIIFCLAPTYVIGMQFCFVPAIFISYIFIVSIDAFIAYIEFKVRIPATIIEQMPVDERELSYEDLYNESFFDRPEVWMNPDMTAVELAKMMGTNRTYLWKKIKSLGYSSYSDMINRKRVKYICEKLKSGYDNNIIQLMFESGFRSRSTAGSEFKRIMGCTPAEFSHFEKTDKHI